MPRTRVSLNIKARQLGRLKIWL